MKARENKKYIAMALCLAIVGIMGTSCVKLEQEPLSYYTQENYTPSPQSFEAIANGLYLQLYSGGETNGNYKFNCRVFAMNVGADDVVNGGFKSGGTNNQRITFIDELNVFPYSDLVLNDGKSDVAHMWSNMYALIQASSTFIKDVLLYKISPDIYGADTSRLDMEFNINLYQDLVNSGSLLPDTTTQLLGEGYFMRALAYFYLVRFFGDVPCYGDYSNKFSINGEVAKNEQISRTPAKDIYEKMIIRDLQLAIALLPTTSRTGNNSRPSQWAAKTCLADVYMQMSGWPLKINKYAEARDLCKDIIDNSGLSLTPVYDNLWKEDKKTESNEHLFALHHDRSKNLASNYGMSYYPQEEAGWHDYLLDSAFYEAFHPDRRKSFIGVTTFAGSINWKVSAQRSPAIGKYRDYGDVTSAQTNGITPIYRYAQVLLMYAEAANQVEGGPNALAEEYVRQVQRRSFNGSDYLTSGLSQSAFDKVVFDELGWEFAVEAKRWFQLVRKEKVVAQNQFNPKIKATLTARGINTEIDAQVGKGYLFPIPTSVVEAANDIGVVFTQNPGY